jgi:hypothetical protein
MAHKREIDAQIEEKRRMRQLEEEQQDVANAKVEAEAREQLYHQQHSNDTKRQNPQYKNIEKMYTTAPGDRERDVCPSVLQGEANRHDKDAATARSNMTDTRASEVYKARKMAELGAAEEKHRRLLKRLRRGGHDTTQLERKFAEYKARITGQAMPYDYSQKQVGYNPTSQQQNTTQNRIFPVMREDTSNMLPAELSEEDLKRLLR